LKPILVYGWYNHGNIGDELFKLAFQKLFPEQVFIFTDILNAELLNSVSTVFFGGGSFLLDPPNISAEDLNLLKSKKIFYIGVGVEEIIDPIHIDLLKISHFIAIRNSNKLDKILEINKNTICIPDLVNYLNPKISNFKRSKSVLILNNTFVVPNYDEPYWKHTAWHYFKSEFAQFLDFLIEEGHSVTFFGMSHNDLDASVEILNIMKHKESDFISNTDFECITKIFSQYEVLITQRFHGAILGNMLKIPHLVISHHNKLKNFSNSLSYYEISKKALIDFFNKIQDMEFKDIDKSSYCILQANINKFLP